ncbi:MAG: hypothetical protein HY680_07115 [Chloroflexi bacterium]|nr:hypothetical protein [Chloroflexota bacterium]
MENAIVNLWADIGADAYWDSFLKRAKARMEFVPFSQRWPQPGFVGSQYYGASTRVVVMGQNPRASNTTAATDADKEMFRLIKQHGDERTIESLNTLFAMMRSFMLGVRYKPAWRPITAVQNHLGLRLDDIAYLNLIPLATYNDRIVPDFREAFGLSTERQLALLEPAKIVVYGKGAYGKFMELGGRDWEVNYIEQRNSADAPAVKAWLRR